jgi:SAM-dependent methyltransferase
MTNNPLEKLYTWSPEKISWYADACRYSGNDRNRKLASAIIDALPQSPHICDIGCGIGALSLELMKKASLVTAVDINRYALQYLQASVKCGEYKNIEVVEGDFAELEPPTQKVDGLVFCMVGGNNFLEQAKHWTNGKVIIINEVSRKCSFASTPRIGAKYDGGSNRSRLEEAGYIFEEAVIKTSFGQPFRNFEDAVSFVSCYDREGSRADIERMLLGQLEETDSEEFPLYLPTDKEYYLYTVNL